MRDFLKTVASTEMHSVCAMQNHQRAMEVHFFGNGLLNELAVLIGHVKGVFAQKRMHLNISVGETHLTQNAVFNAGASVFEGAVELIIGLFDGPTSGDNNNVLSLILHNGLILIQTLRAGKTGVTFRER